MCKKLKNLAFYLLIVFMLSACKIAEVKNDVFNVSGGAANNADFVMEEKSGVPLIEEWLIYAGTNEGLFAVSSFGNTKALWTGGSVKKIISIPGEKESWAMLSGEGILVSHDLINWEKRNQGLPVKTIKIYENGQKSFVNIMQDLKDLEVNPSNPDIMVCTTSERIYLTRNQGQSWTALAAHPYTAHGIKAVASAFLPELTIFMSHSTNGVHYIQPDTAGARWTRLQQGLELLETTSSSDEVSDIVVMQNELSSSHEIYVSQTFKRRIYKLDWNAKAFNLLWSDQSRFGTVDSLYPDNDGLYFLYEGHTAYLDFNGHMKEQPEITSIINSLPSGLKPNCIIIDDAPSASQKILLSELWLLKEPRDISAEIAANREGIYLPVEIALDRNRLDSYIDLMKKAGLNMITIDMKDEDGRLRFTPQNSDVVSKGRVFRPVDIDPFLAEMKQKGIYTVARIVAFKDSVLAANGSGRYSVWDRNNIPWVASNNERWVDPYSEEVWEYIAMISEELCRRGFDEIQFDYIRFPTDGTNLSDARYRWQDTGMDMESAILSFLRHIRPRVKAPISIDIYGSNGFYRTSARTGQDVELLAPWVDVICPMYYPSHWEQWFFAQAPAELRPWRIYYTGTLRNDRIARGQTIIRPWAQAFYLNVSYDRQYYNKDYVRRQIEGMREAGIGGYTYWNILGRYDDITLLE